MMMKMKILVMGVNEWKMEEEKKEGVSVFYLTENPVQELNKKGYFPIKKSLSKELAYSLSNCKFPQLCDVEMSVVATVGNKMDFNIQKITPVKEVDLWK